MRLGWIGLGEIGAPMAQRLVAAGHDLTVWNRTAARMQPLVEAGASTASSPAELAGRVAAVLTCIDTPSGLDEVLFGADGVVAATQPPLLIVDHSTMHPGVTRRQGERLGDAGIGMVDAPVSGGPQGAQAGTLAVFLGGGDEAVATARPIVAAYADRITHLGPLGSGQVAKLCNQVINFATMAAIAEATALGVAFGLDPAVLAAAMSGGLADSNMLREYARGSAAGETTSITGIIDGLQQLLLGVPAPATGGRVDILLKDLGAALDVARSSGSAAPVAGMLEGVYRLLLNQGRGPQPPR